MAFKPKQTPKPFTQREFVKLPIPAAGNQPAVISMIVDLGEQPQYFEDEATKEIVQSKQKPFAQEVAVFADLVDQVVDYGGDIGMKQYRLMLNDQWFGEIKGFKFTHVIPRDAEGNIIKGRIPTFHPKNKLSLLATATGCSHILGKDTENNMDISQLLGKAFMLDIEVTQRPDKNDKKDDKGEPIVYTNVKGKSPTPLPMFKGKPMEAEPLSAEPMLIVWSDPDNFTATEENVKMLRKDIIRKIQKANNYPGSKMEELIKKLGLEVATEELAKLAKETKAEAATEDSHDDVVEDTHDEILDDDNQLGEDDPF